MIYHTSEVTQRGSNKRKKEKKKVIMNATTLKWKSPTTPTYGQT